MFFQLKNIKLTYKVMPLVLIGTLTALIAGFSLLLSQINLMSENQLTLSKELLNTEQKISKELQQAALKYKAVMLGDFLSAVAGDLILTSDIEALIEYKSNAEKDPDITYLEYLDPDSKPFIAFSHSKKDSVIEKRFKVESDGDLLGFVLLGISQKRVNSAIIASGERVKSAVMRVETNSVEAYNSFLIILGTILFGIIIMVIGTVYFAFKRIIISRLDHTTTLINELSQGNGDLTKRLPLPNNDEISQLCGSVNQFVETLQNMVLKISGNVDQLSQEAHSLEMQGQQLSEHALVQLGEAASTSSSMTQMTQSMQEVSDSSERAESMVGEADAGAQEGTKVVNETTSAITRLSSEISETSVVINSLQDESEKIGGVLEVIRGIAEQTNLLALNAAIEAARAGDQGRGFAVVADEVRTLASRTQTATEEINMMIETLQSGSKKASSAMEKSCDSAERTVEQIQLADTALRNIVAAVKTISEINSDIATAAEGQKRVAASVGESVLKINQTSQKTEESANNTAEVSVILNGLASDLKGMVSQFKV